MAADADDGDAGHATAAYITLVPRPYLVHDSDAWSEEKVTADGLSREPVSTRRRLRWDRDVDVEGEVRRGVDTFGEHEAAEPDAFLRGRRHQDHDVPEWALRLASHATAAATIAAVDHVVALVGPVLASNRDRVPDAQFRRTIEQNARCHTSGVRRRQTEGGNEHDSQDQPPQVPASHS